METSTSKTALPIRWIGAAAVAGGVLGALAIGALGNSSNTAGSAAPATQSFVSISQSEPAAGGTETTNVAATGPGSSGPSGGPGRPAETALTGDAAHKAKAAALAAVPGSTVDRVENDADGGSPYEAHVTKADGSRATVKMDKDFKVTSVETDAGHRGGGHGGPGGRDGRGGHGDETPLTGDTAEKVKAAALGAVPGGTVDRVENDADGGSPYEAHVTKADGSRVTVRVDKDFKVTGVDDNGGR